MLINNWGLSSMYLIICSSDTLLIYCGGRVIDGAIMAEKSPAPPVHAFLVTTFLLPCQYPLFS